MAELSFDVTGNNSDLINKVSEIRDVLVAFKELQKKEKEAADANKKMSFSFKEVWKALDGTKVLKKFVSDVVKVRGEVQQLENNLSNLLQSKDKASVLMSQIMKTAAATPFSITELGDGAKQLLTYGLQAEDVNDTLLHLGDIASGLGLPLNELTSLYGSVISQGSLYAQDLYQFTASGIPLLQGLADMYGVTTEKVNTMVAAGQIGFPEVQRAIKGMTDEGGQFYNQMDIQSDTIAGKINNLGDAWDIMLNKIGESQDGVLNGSLDSAKYLIENYETLGRILVGIIGIYGTYKTAAMLATAVSQGYTVSQIAQYNVLLLVEKAQKILNLTVLKNPYVAAAVAISGLISAMWAFSDHTSVAEKEQEKLNKRTEEYEKGISDLKKQIGESLSIIQDETATQYDKAEAFKKLQELMPSVYGGYKTEKELIDHLTEARKRENDEIRLNRELKNIEEHDAKVDELKDLKRLKQLESVGEAGRIRQGTQGTYQFLYSRYQIYEKDFFDTNATHIDKLIQSTTERIGTLQNVIRNQEQTAWELTLDTMSKTTAEAQKTMYKGYKILLDQSGKDWIQIEGSKAPINSKMITDRIQQLNQKVLLVEEKDAAQYKKEAKTAWEDAQKAVEDIKSSKKKYRSPEQYEKALSEAQKKEKSAKETFENRGGVIDNGDKAKYAQQLHKQKEYLKELLDKQALEQRYQMEDLENKNRQAKIDAMDESSTKTLAQMKLNHDKELQELVREKDAFLRQKIEDAKAVYDAKDPNGKSQFDPSSIQLTHSEDKIFSDRKENLKVGHNNEIGKYYETLTNIYQNYTDQRLAIEKKYNADITTLQEARKQYDKEGNTDKVEQTDRAIVQATKDKGQNLMQLDYEQLKQTPEYIRAFENLKYTSSETLNSLLGKLESSKQTASKVLNPEQLREYTTTIQEIMDELDERNPFQSLVDKKEDLALAKNELSNAQIELENARKQAEDVKNGKQVENGVTTKYNPNTGKIDSTKVYLSEAQALNKVKEKTEIYNRAKDNVVEKTEKVKVAEEKTRSVIDNLSKSINNLGTSIGGPAGEIISLIGDIGSFTMMAMSGVEVASKTSSTAIQTVEKASVILAVIGAAVQIAMKIASLFNKDAKKEKNIEKIQDQIDVLKRSYDDLGDAVDKAYSTDASELIDQQNEILKQQKLLIQNQILEEKSKKKPDDGRIKEYENQLLDIDKQIGQNKEKQIDAIMGSDLKSAIDDFAQAYADAWSAGNDRARSSKDLVKDMIKQMVMESLKAASSEPMEKLRKKLAEFYKDGIISAWEREQIEKDAEAITKDLDSKYGWADEYLRGEEEGTSQADGSKGGFETMSQETGEELNGRFTALQVSNEEIRNSMTAVLGNLSSLCTTASDGNVLLSEMRNLAVMSNGHLEDIAKHTKVLLGFGEKLDRIEQNTGRI